MALSTQRASASFLSNESTPPWKYDVFLSFRGVDTRKGFVSLLYGELCKRLGIRTFFDDRELEGGTSAIQKSHTAIVVLSPNYASSKWCMDELTTILQCMEARQSVLPVFYETDPSDVGNPRGCFAKAFAEHEENLISTEGKKKIVQWKADLKRVSKISGRHWKNFKSDRELIDDIVKWVWMKVQATFTLSDSSRKLVGTDYAFEQLSLLLAHDANDVRFIGITGMGGIGKTTLAKLVYDKICRHFEVHCFLANVREVCAKNGIVDLAKKLLFPFLRERIAEIWDEERVSILIEKFLHNKKVLLILDDVDELKQLEVFAGNQGWFGMGSRIIVTTRNQRLLVEHGIETSYKVQGLNDAEALELFSLHAFKKDQPEEDFLELSKHFLDYAGGLPLVLKTLGSSLYARGQDAWNSVRDNLRKIPNPTVFYLLKVSFDGLGEMEKRIFLDVACFHKGNPMTDVLRILDLSFGISTSSLIDILIETSLVYYGYGNIIGMHDLIQEMAWEIVREESKEPGQRSRFWHSEILTTNTVQQQQSLFPLGGVGYMNPRTPLHITTNTANSAEWIFLATSLFMEILSAACDQASSPGSPRYALFSMLLSTAALLTSIWELIYKGMKRNAVWGRRGCHMLFGSEVQLFVLAASITQCVCSIIQYVYYIRRADNPIKMSLLPAIFLICVMATRLCRKRMLTT